MESNISFKSNVYPAFHNDPSKEFDKWICYSDAYLRKIISLEKMSQIREKQVLRSLPRHWNIQQEARFKSMKYNPYIGLKLINGEYVIIKNEDVPQINSIKCNPLEYDPKSVKSKLIPEKTGHETVEINGYKPVTIVELEQPHESISAVPQVEAKRVLEVISAQSEYIQEEQIVDIEEDVPAVEDVTFSKPEVSTTKNIFEYFKEMGQKDIIEADSKNILFVNAGPGTGKTYSLIKRIEHLVMEYNIDATEIQVLCYTNAAVKEIKERLRNTIQNGGARSLANVDIRTFHSFSWWLINQANTEKWHNVSLQQLNYDGSIKAASKIMSNRKFFSQVVGNWSHFIVDEIQDLTNHLARFVLHIVNACIENNTGVTVLGDSCQAIYDYTLKDEKSVPMSSQDFYDALFRKASNDGKYINLSKNHRQKGNLTDFALNYRISILSQNIEKMQNEIININEKIGKIENDYLSIADYGKIDKIRNNDRSSKVCFACRNNGQTLKLSSVFRKKGIEHTLNVDTTENNYCAWLSEIFFDYKQHDINLDVFINRYNSLVSQPISFTPEQIWERIQHLTKSEGIVNIQNLFKLISSSSIDDTCFRYINENNILVSNIHKTKGREYDHFVTDQSFVSDLIKKEHDIGEYKTLYVALTRFKKSVCLAKLSQATNQGAYKIPIFKTRRDRYGRLKYDKIIAFELKSNIDINTESYASTEIQKYLKKVQIGDPIELLKIIENGRVVYSIIHNSDDIPTKIGRLNDTFREDLAARMKLDDADFINLPDSVTDLYVSGKYTHIASEEFLKANPEIKKLSPHGVWQWIEFIGIGLAKYDTY